MKALIKIAIILALTAAVVLLPIVESQTTATTTQTPTPTPTPTPPLTQYQYFETVRGQLLSAYNSEIVAHSAVVLGLIIAMGAAGKDAINAIRNKKAYIRFWGFTAFAIVIFLILVEVGRVEYWSTASSYAYGLSYTHPPTGYNFSASTDYTTWMAFMNNYSSFGANKGLPVILQPFSPNNFYLLLGMGLIFAFIVIVFSITILRLSDKVLALSKKVEIGLIVWLVIGIAFFSALYYVLRMSKFAWFVLVVGIVGTLLAVIAYYVVNVKWKDSENKNLASVHH